MTKAESTGRAAQTTTSRLLLIVLAYLGFISLGLPDGLNGVAWPSIRVSFHLPIDALGTLLLMFTSGYLLSSFSSGRILARLNVGMLLALSCLATAFSLLGYAVVPHWWMMLALAVVAGLGAGAIDAGLNTFAAMHFSARMVNWLHACYGIGTTAGPLLMTAVLMRGGAWQWGYAIVGAWQLLLAICFAVTFRSWPTMRVSDEAQQAAIMRAASNRETLRMSVTWLSLAVFFVYTGIEAAVGAWTFSLLTMSRAMATETAGTWVSVYWGSFTFGRIVSGLMIHATQPQRLLRGSLVGIIAGALLVWLNLSNALSGAGIALIGLSAAPIFPTLIATTPGRLGERHTANAVGFQIAAAVLGQSLLPGLIGVLAGKFSLEIISPAVFIAAVWLLLLQETLLSKTTNVKIVSHQGQSPGIHH